VVLQGSGDVFPSPSLRNIVERKLVINCIIALGLSIIGSERKRGLSLSPSLADEEFVQPDLPNFVKLISRLRPPPPGGGVRRL